ncbi:helix-turn-helix transcriptional regulator [Thiocapsa sp.]|uniref:helix-turn-helix transcriptional regulator n=1 Tax=Thiocapsa sp. TaxID=2024551 RepID=UPI0025E8F658|nr:helix-turn-helix transcriptional regulator [Thiocapsa sp.]
MSIPLVRAQHLIHFIAVLRDIGVPVERELERSRLPVSIEQTPGDYVSFPRALEWVWRSNRDVAIMDLGFIAGCGMSIGALDPDTRRAVIAAPTGLARIAAVADHIHRENSAQKISTRREGGYVRVAFEICGFQTNPFVGFAEWLNIQGIIAIIRSAAGAAWCPAEITFISRVQPSDAALEAYGSTRILTGQPSCSLLVAQIDLARTCIDRQAHPQPQLEGADDPTTPTRTPSGLGEAWDFVTALRAIIRPYLPQGYPNLSLVAEIAGMSERTLQRRLAQCGLTYSRIVEEVRFDIASDLLADPSRNIIDIAHAAGYGNAPHFSRAFRRLTGMSPRDYRRAGRVSA